MGNLYADMFGRVGNMPVHAQQVLMVNQAVAAMNRLSLRAPQMVSTNPEMEHAKLMLAEQQADMAAAKRLRNTNHQLLHTTDALLQCLMPPPY